MRSGKFAMLTSARDCRGSKCFARTSRGESFETPLLGEFNLLNCLAVIVAADALGRQQGKNTRRACEFSEREATCGSAWRRKRRAW